MVIGLSSDVDRDRSFQVCFAVTSSDKEIVGVIPNILGHDHRLLLIPLPELRVGDVDGVVMATFRVVDNEADRCVVSIVGCFCDPLEVDSAEDGADFIVVGEWLGADGKLGQGDFFGRSVFWG